VFHDAKFDIQFSGQFHGHVDGELLGEMHMVIDHWKVHAIPRLF
jgi:hypothetical protein